MEQEIDPKTGFPEIENGCCDGLGCGKGAVCWCNEYKAMKEEFQRVFNKAWDTKYEWDGQDIDCVNWEKSWRFGTSSWKRAEEKVFEFNCKVPRFPHNKT